MHTSEYLPVVLSTGFSKKTLVCGLNEEEASNFSVACIPTLQGFYLGLEDEGGNISYTSSPGIYLSPLGAVIATSMLHRQIKTLTVRRTQGVVNEFDDLTLAFLGMLDEYSIKKLAEKFSGSTPDEFTEAMRRLPEKEEFLRMLSEYSIDDGEAFYFAVEAVAAYMIANGDIDPAEREWLKGCGLLSGDSQ